MRLCFQWNCVWGDWKLIWLHLFRKCFIHLHVSSERKDLDRDGNPSLADCTSLTMEERENQSDPNVFCLLCLWNTCGFQRGLDGVQLCSKRRADEQDWEFPSTPLPPEKSSNSRDFIYIHMYVCIHIKRILSVFKTEKNNPSLMSVSLSFCI